MKLDYLEAVEASAGTGKTFTLAQRVLEEVAGGIPVGRIVVVTFTVAATASLKTRVRARLRDALQGLRARNSGASWDAPDDVLGAWVEGAGPLALARLQQALVDFDEAAISTIHSFCSRLLISCAFQAGASLANTEGTAAVEAAKRVVEDALRGLVTDTSPLFVRAIQAARLDRAALQELAFRAPEVEAVAIPERVEPSGDPPDLRDYERALEAARAAADWDSLEATFVGNDALVAKKTKVHRTSFPPVQTRKDIGNLRRWLGTLSLLAPFPSCAVRFTTASIAGATVIGATAPTHPVVAAMDEMQRLHGPLSEALSTWATRLRRELVDRIRAATLDEARRRDERSFEDLLRQVRDSVHKQELRRAVEDRWDLAMVDEFQDTDPVQWAVFRQLFAGKRLLVVGDPKQSIYAFRRADIHSYVEAVNCAGRTTSLTTNFRSDQRLLDAIAHLFAGPAPFATQSITFEPVEGHHKANRLGDARAPLYIHHIRRLNAPGMQMVKRGSLDRWALQPLCVQRVAEDIAVELNTFGVRPSTCAVLTRTNPQASQVRDALRERGIPSVLRTTETAFSSPVSGELLTVLRAMFAPGDKSAVGRALVTRLMGKTAQALVDLKATPADWARCMTDMRRWNTTWREHGVIAALQEWAQEAEVWTRLLARPSGGRDAADLRHLFALLHRAEFEERRAPAALLAWLAADGPGTDEELAAQRVESDDDAVQISTIHKAKGLEYDRVWLPFAWAATFIGKADRHVPRYWDADRGSWVLDVRVPVPQPAIDAMLSDKLREDLRQTYVALTRARHRCVVYWGPAGDESALGYLLHRGSDPGTVEELRKRARRRAREDSQIGEDLKALCQHPFIDAAWWNPTYPTPVSRWEESEPLDPAALETRPRQRAVPLDTWWRRMSYSKMLRGRTEGVTNDEEPKADRDATAEADLDLESSPPQGAPLAGDIPLAELEGGPHVGDTVHDALEFYDFQAAPDELGTLVGRYAQAHGVDASFVEPLTDSLHAALQTPLFDDGFHLAQLPWRRTLREPSFVLPIRGGYEPTRPLSSKQLATCFDEPLASLVAGLGFLPVTGFLEGRLDLIFEHDGRFHLLDWKSNKLGKRWSDYAGPRLEAAMTKAGYHLQAQLYALALHKLLEQRLGAAYRFDEHFGEIIYAFVRGMSPETGACGIWRHRPTLASLQKLEAMLKEAS